MFIYSYIINLVIIMTVFYAAHVITPKLIVKPALTIPVYSHAWAAPQLLNFII